MGSVQQAVVRDATGSQTHQTVCERDGDISASSGHVVREDATAHAGGASNKNEQEGGNEFHEHDLPVQLIADVIPFLF